MHDHSTMDVGLPTLDVELLDDDAMCYGLLDDDGLAFH
jgi:hypothetical protein